MAVTTSGNMKPMDFTTTPTLPEIQPMNEFDPTGGGEGPALTGTSTGGGSSSGYYNYIINQQKIEADRAAAAARAAGVKEQEAYLRGLIGKGVPAGVSAALTEQQRAGEQFIREQEAGLLDLLGQRYGQATGRTTGAYDALRNYLAANAPTAYAQAQRAVPQINQTALGQYMAGQGVSPAAAQQAVEVQNVLGAGGAANYNQLLNVLAAREAATQQSRLAEEQMARGTGLAGLSNLYTQGQFNLQQQRLASLADLASRIAAARLSAEQQAAQRDVALQNAIAGLYGTGYVTPPAQPSAPEVPMAALTPVQQLQQLTTNATVRNPALAQRVAQIVARNPQATLAQVQRQFPQLGQTIARRMA